MMEVIKVSVVIPIYNASIYLRECMDSLLGQSLNETEFICINDGSSDDSLRILKEYAVTDGRVRIIEKENSGYGSTVNLGIVQAQGEYISIVEPDDYIEKEMLKTLYECAREHRLDIVSSDYRWFFDDIKRRVFDNHRVYENMEFYEKVLNPGEDDRVIRGKFINPAGLFRRQFLQERQIMHNETPGASFQDRGFCFLSLIQAERIMVLPKKFYNYRHDNPNSSIAGRDDIDKVILEYRMTLKKILQMDDAYHKYLPEHFRREYESCRYALSRGLNSVKKDAVYKISKEFRGYEEGKILSVVGLSAELQDELQMIMYVPEKVYLSLKSLNSEIHRKISEFKSFVIYGAGVVGRRIFQGLDDEDRKKFLGFAVSDIRGNPDIVENCPVKNIEEYADRGRGTAVIIGVTKKYRDEIKERLWILGFRNIIIPESMGANL